MYSFEYIFPAESKHGNENLNFQKKIKKFEKKMSALYIPIEKAKAQRLRSVGKLEDVKARNVIDLLLMHKMGDQK